VYSPFERKHLPTQKHDVDVGEGFLEPEREKMSEDERKEKAFCCYLWCRGLHKTRDVIVPTWASDLRNMSANVQLEAPTGALKTWRRETGGGWTSGTLSDLVKKGRKFIS